MRLVELGIVALTLSGYAQASHAQVQTAQVQPMTPADLIGLWKGVPGLDPGTTTDGAGRVTLHAVLFRPDSTFTEAWATATGYRCQQGRWVQLAGDTIVWQGGLRNTILLRGQQLSVFDLQNQPTEVYQRVDLTTMPQAAQARLTVCPTVHS